MKKILKVIIVIFIFYISIIIFTTIDFTIMANKYQNEYGYELGLGSIILQIASTWRFAFLTTVVALIVKNIEKIDSTVKNTIYFLPLLSVLSFFVIAQPVCTLVELLGLVKFN